MPRSKAVTAVEAGRSITASLQSVIDAMRSPKARKRLQEQADTLAKQWQFHQLLLNVSRMKPRPSKEQLDAWLRVDGSVILGDSGGKPASADDLRVFEKMCDAIVADLTGLPQQDALAPKDLARFLLRMSSRSGTPKKLKPQFLDAYAAREKARSEGRDITVKALAQQFTRADFENNPESAISKMSQGLRRVLARRKISLDAPPAQVNIKTKNKNVRKR